MAFSGDTFTRLFSWVVNAGNGIKIRSDYMDQDTNDIANGLTTVAGRITTLSTASLKQDGGGNVGIGGTAAGWVGTIGLQAPGDVALAAPFNTHLVSNAYSVSGTWKYLTTGGASRVTTAQGVTTFFNAASGTAGNNITWAQAGQFDANGNLLVGTTTSPYASAGRKVVSLQGSTDSLLAFQGAGDYAWSDTAGNKFEIAAVGATKPIIFVANGAPRMTISSAGVISDSTAELGWKDVPVNPQGSGYTLVLADRGKQVLISTGGVTVPNAVFSAGAIITITNNSASAQTITQGTSLTMHQAGTTNTGNRTLAPWGVCSVLFIAASNCVISGNVS